MTIITRNKKTVHPTLADLKPGDEFLVTTDNNEHPCIVLTNQDDFPESAGEYVWCMNLMTKQCKDYHYDIAVIKVSLALEVSV